MERSWIAELSRRLDPDGGGAEPPLTFRQYVDRVRPGYRWYRHCEKLADLLQRVADDDLKRLMVFMPPRHGKSELVSRLFTGYYLYRHPTRWVGINSYGAELAYTLSRAARAYYLEAGGRVADDAAAVKHWETGRGGGLWAAGVGGPITGKGFHLGVIDDPLKNAEEAESEAIRAKQKEWYGPTFYTREEPTSPTDPHGAVVVIQTRWHEDDLAGWLLAEEAGEDADPERWHVVSMEAIKEADPPRLPPTCTLEPDWREPGEALCPERRPLSKLKQIAKRIGARIFSALFQQRPTPAGGGLFTTFPVLHAMPPALRRVRYWDKAATQGGGDYSVGVLMALTTDGRFVVEHVVRGQWSAAERERVIKDTAAVDGRSVHVWVEQEPGSSGKESAENTVKMLAGYVCQVDRVTGDKETRARPLAAQAEVGNVCLLQAEWNRAFADEASVFPNGRHDDQVDAASGAFNKLVLVPEPAAGAATPPALIPAVPVGVPAGVPHALGGF